jgi:hypothetical protein
LIAQEAAFARVVVEIIIGVAVVLIGAVVIAVTTSVFNWTKRRWRAPFDMTTTTFHDFLWAVFLDDPLPASSTWPPKDATNDDVWRWAKSLLGADEQTKVRIVLTGREQPSAITSMTARIIERRQPDPAARFAHPVEGVAASIEMLFDLEESNPHAYKVLPKGEREPFFDGRTITIAPREIVTIEVTARGKTSECQWVLDMNVLAGKRERVMSIKDRGKPFRTSAGRRDVPAYIWTYYYPERIYRWFGRDEQGRRMEAPVPE